VEKMRLGNTDLYVSRLGVGLAEIGSLTAHDEAQVRQVLNTALDNGINFLDTAACYGNSEELVGRTVSGRRDEFILATKAGHAGDDITSPDWTAETVTQSIERSLRRLQTDHLDLIQLHSCDVDDLERGEVIQALLDAKQAGKTRYIGYSGDNEAARWAIENGPFDTLQTSYNLVDQRARTYLFPQAEARGMGIIAKRPIANGAWGANSAPSAYAAEYYRRFEVMSHAGPVRGEPDNRILLALGFALAEERVDVAIVGTSNPEHMRTNIDWVENELPIDASAVQSLQRQFEQVGRDWDQRG
jgi:aryl-alcohol dehydrogenase-like predicted oxidoreductase